MLWSYRGHCPPQILCKHRQFSVVTSLNHQSGFVLGDSAPHRQPPGQTSRSRSRPFVPWMMERILIDCCQIIRWSSFRITGGTSGFSRIHLATQLTRALPFTLSLNAVYGNECLHNQVWVISTMYFWHLLGGLLIVHTHTHTRVRVPLTSV